MATHLSHLIRKEVVAEETMAFYFEKPEGFAFVAGQHATFRLVNPSETDEEGNERTFSFITTPSEELIGIATRMRGTAFKRSLRTMNKGDQIEIINPRGDMVLPNSISRPMVILSGGIGITPFMSIIKEYAAVPTDYPLTLFYANRTPAEAAFMDELTEIAKLVETFHFVPTMTRLDTGDASWHGEVGYVTEKMLRKYVPVVDNTVFYTAGPAGMVAGMMELLSTLGVDSLFIKSEDYGEYK